MIEKPEVQADNFYNGEYFEKNPSLHAEDAELKAKEVLRSFNYLPSTIFNKKRISILDVGGGSGLIMSIVKQELSKKSFSIDTLALDISSKMIEIQRQTMGNANFKGYVASVEQIPKGVKADVTLMLDVLEHVPNHIKALKELRRVSDYIIFRIPIDNSVILNILDRILSGRIRQYLYKQYGHCHTFSLKQVRETFESELGTRLYTEILNDYLHGFKLHIPFLSSLYNLLGALLFKINKQLALSIVGGAVTVVIACKSPKGVKRVR